MTQDTYDPVTYILKLFWRLRCLEASPQDFQKLFEDVAARAHDRFMRVRPYGTLGDRKCDGLLWDDGTVYQVYSPEEIKPAETRRKIYDDLAGAIAEWGDQLKRWIFVYNVRRGLAPYVPTILREQEAKYPSIRIEPMSTDDLWKIVETLPLQAKVELLGPPPGYEALFPLSTVLPDEVQERLRNGRFVVVQEILSPINIEDAIKALEPTKPFAPPLFLRPPDFRDSWGVAADYQKALIEEAFERRPGRLPRFAVFSLSPIPLAIHLGYLLSDRVEVEPYQYDRDRRTWRWDPGAGPGDLQFTVRGMPTAVINEPVEATIRVSLSASIRQEDTRRVVGGLPVEIDLMVKLPEVMWLVSPGQLSALGKALRQTLAELRDRVPGLRRVHLFYAGPTGGAIVVGQAINPRMNPPVALYEYDRQREPRYVNVLNLPQATTEAGVNQSYARDADTEGDA